MRPTGLLTFRFLSEALGVETSFTAIFPVPRKPSRRAPRLLYLLHGYSDDDSVWSRQSSLERHVAAYDVAVVMPAANLSFYSDMKSGAAYHAFIAEELPGIVGRLFQVSTKREDTFIAGQSMGGYGAFRLALEYPNRFAAAASLSGVLDIAAKGLMEPGPFRDQLQLIFGDVRRLRGSKNDLEVLLKTAVADQVPLPRLYACCGTGDYLLEGNHRFRDVAASLKAPLVYEEGAGIHDWAYWDGALPRVLSWLFGKPSSRR